MQGRAGVEVRIGINTGEVVMRMVQTGGHTEYSPVGHAINLARAHGERWRRPAASSSVKRRGDWSKAISSCALGADRSQRCR